MTYRQTGPVEVRPNTLRDQTPPNTFRTRPVVASQDGRVDQNRLGAGVARSRRTSRPGSAARPGLSPVVYVAMALLVFILVLYLLNGAP